MTMIHVRRRDFNGPWPVINGQPQAVPRGQDFDASPELIEVLTRSGVPFTYVKASGDFDGTFTIAPSFGPRVSVAVNGRDKQLVTGTRLPVDDAVIEALMRAAVPLIHNRLQFPIPAIVNLKRSNTAAIRAAMDRTDRNAIVPVIGPSTAGGQSTGGGGAQAVNSWPMRLAAILQEMGINAGANNAYPDKSGWGATQNAANYMAGDARIVLTGGAAPGGTKTVGGNAITMTAANGAGSIAATFQGPVSKYEVWTRDNGTGRTYSWSLDGGATTTNVSSLGLAVPQKTIINAGSAGMRTLLLQRVAGDVTLLGINAYDDTNSRRETSFLNWGISGALSPRFLDNTDTAGGSLAMWAAQAPDAAILDDWPINDWRFSLPVATSKANLVAGIQRQKLYGDPIVTTPIWDASTSGLSAQQDAYAAAAYEAAMEQDVPLIDIRAAWVSFATANGLGWYSDTVHPSVLGYLVKAIMMAVFFQRLKSM